MTQVFTWHVSPETTSMRLDLFLQTQNPEHSRSFLKKQIESGHVEVNDVVVKKAGFNLKASDIVSLSVVDLIQSEICPEDIELDIVYEDSALIVVNKPINMVVHPGAGHLTGTLVHALLHHCKDLSGIGGVERPGIVHRLDKDTSGLLVIAKHDQAHRHLAEQLKQRHMKRIYYALAEFGFHNLEGVIAAPIGRHPIDRKKMAVVENGRFAQTFWHVKREFDKQYTLLELHLQTGRTHQIRVHLKHIQHPLVGDPLYGSRKNHHFRVERPLLHARYLQFIHPVSAKVLRFEAPIPEDFQRILDFLDQKYPR